MTVHIFSRSKWDEPHRLRQQLAGLLSSGYQVEYWSPKSSGNLNRLNLPNELRLRQFRFIERFASVPFVSIANAIFLYFYLKANVKKGDVVFNFLPELIWIPRQRCSAIISVLNDDFASMAPKVSAWWVRWMLKRMAAKADAALYVSTLLRTKYPAKNGYLFYPWSDFEFFSEKNKKRRDVILYWGYISSHLNLEQIEEMARQILDSSLSLEIHLVGPLDSLVSERILELAQKFSCVKYFPPRSLKALDMERVLCGLELLGKDFKNAGAVEFPNKAPRLLAYGIPLVFSGCALLKEPYFIEYQENISALVSEINEKSDAIDASISDYFLKNNSKIRLDKIREILKKVSLSSN
ncbi:hypothetical protein SAMN05443579_113104 [Variovorax sp. PDC80]|uniref:glycosyltransferase family 4 protein n=1 Tax=Variovorax sp. PDC80 TaxID=1882827 RepID=UPI0008E6539B|nr:glycosyltransferase family 4 protein [Variovorax sp. PDC80]SFP63916.1 hypothetical protein SAMN05443579_113104 [Variovorax sp. PDC80]